MDITNPFAKKQAVPKSLLSAQQFINIKDIAAAPGGAGRFLYTKDDQIFAYIKIHPVCTDLLSDSEKHTLVRGLSAELSCLDKPFKFFAISRPVDISGLLDEYMALYANSTEDVQKALLEQEIKLYKDFTRSGEVAERNFYMIIWERAADDAEYALGRRSKELVYRFRNCGIDAEALDENEIVRLCNFFANPSYAHDEHVDLGIGIPILTKGANDI